jgi:N-acyl-D-amino-acid deacylase
LTAAGFSGQASHEIAIFIASLEIAVLDVAIRGARIIDGSGGPIFEADIGIADRRIVAIGGVIEARHEVDADGLVAAPGFIDVHTHDDRLPLIDPVMTPKITQGITTVIVGNCGISAAPAPSQDAAPAPLTLLGLRRRAFFGTFDAYARAVIDAKPALNIVGLIGHTSLRTACMSEFSRAATPTELGAMQMRLKQSLEAGAFGLSTGLYYPPARAAPSSEVEALLRVVADYRGLQTAHLRDEGDHLLAALDEALTSAARHSTALVISHLKCASPKMWRQANQVLTRIEAAAARQAVAFDVYPYAASSTMLLADRLKGARRVIVSWSEPCPDVAGQDLETIAQSWNCSTEEAVARLSPAGAIYFKMEEADVRTILAHPMAMIGSDGLPHDRHPHPRLWGTFPRVLGTFVRDMKLISLSEAIRRMTSLPAQVFGLNDRGIIAEGKVADLMLFDADMVADTATFDRPTERSAGIAHVFVNGVECWRHGEPTGARSGQMLNRGSGAV